jgi:hypothetical protein
MVNNVVETHSECLYTCGLIPTQVERMFSISIISPIFSSDHEFPSTSGNTSGAAYHTEESTGYAEDKLSGLNFPIRSKHSSASTMKLDCAT